MIILDREGTILQHKEPYILHQKDIKFIPGSISALKKILEKDIHISVVSNQSPINRGLISDVFVQSTNKLIFSKINKKSLNFSFYYCPHTDENGCSCRKPKPGLLLQAMQNHNVMPNECWMVGDTDTDMLAGLSAGIEYNFHLLSGRQLAPSLYAKKVYGNLNDLVKSLDN